MALLEELERSSESRLSMLSLHAANLLISVYEFESERGSMS
jgi:hypothetical protein